MLAGGLSMKITHTHPTYTDQQERLQRLQDTKKVCIAKVHASRHRKVAS
jgi:hypothetical protein